MPDSSELTAPDVYRLWRYKGRASLAALAEGTALSTGRIEAIGYRDVADGLLGLFGPHRWVWRDKRGREISGGSLPVALVRIGLDVASLPLILAMHHLRAQSIVRRGPSGLPWIEGRPPAYLRMDHLFDLKAGGSVAHTSGVINALRRLLGRIVILSTDPLALVSPDDDFHVLTPHYGVGRNLALVPQLTYNQQIARWWRKNRFKPGFVYGRYSLGNYAAAMIAQREGVPYVCEYNGSNIWISRNWDTARMPFESLMALIEDVNLFAADLIVAVSKPSKDELVARGVPPGRVIVNPNGVDPDTYRPDRDGEPVRRKLGIARNEVVIAFIGTFGNWHGAEVLADAFGRMLANNPDLGARVRLLLIGDGGKMPVVQKILQRSGAINRTILTGTVPQPEAPDYLAAADIFAKSARTQSRRNPVLRFAHQTVRIYGDGSGDRRLRSRPDRRNPGTREDGLSCPAGRCRYASRGHGPARTGHRVAPTPRRRGAHPLSCGFHLGATHQAHSGCAPRSRRSPFAAPRVLKCGPHPPTVRSSHWSCRAIMKKSCSPTPSGSFLPISPSFRSRAPSRKKAIYALSTTEAATEHQLPPETTNEPKRQQSYL